MAENLKKCKNSNFEEKKFVAQIPRIFFDAWIQQKFCITWMPIFTEWSIKTSMQIVGYNKAWYEMIKYLGIIWICHQANFGPSRLPFKRCFKKSHVQFFMDRQTYRVTYNIRLSRIKKYYIYKQINACSPACLLHLRCMLIQLLSKHVNSV